MPKIEFFLIVALFYIGTFFIALTGCFWWFRSQAREGARFGRFVVVFIIFLWVFAGIVTFFMTKLLK